MTDTERIKRLAEWVKSEYILWLNDGLPWVCDEDMVTPLRPWDPRTRIQDTEMLWDKLAQEGKTLLISTGKHKWVSNYTDEGLPCDGWSWDDENISTDSNSLGNAVCEFILKMIEVKS